MAASSSLNHVLANYYGVQLIGNFVYLLLYGISCLQTFIYYMNPSDDPLFLKVLPLWLMILQTLHQILLCVTSYKVFVNNFGNYGYLLTIIPLEPFIANIFQGLLTLGAHLFFIYRIWKFGKTKPRIGDYVWIFPSICIPLAVTQLVLIIVETSFGMAHGHTVTYVLSSPTWIGIAYATATLGLFLDAVFVVAMTWLLLLEGRSPMARTNDTINKLIVLTVNSGLVTMVAALAALVLLAASPKTLIYIFFYYLLPPLYCNTVLANLNVRGYIRKEFAMHPGSQPAIFSTRIEFTVDSTQSTAYAPNETMDRVTRLDNPGESNDLEAGSLPPEKGKTTTP